MLVDSDHQRRDKGNMEGGCWGHVVWGSGAGREQGTEDTISWGRLLGLVVFDEQRGVNEKQTVRYNGLQRAGQKVGRSSTTAIQLPTIKWGAPTSGASKNRSQRCTLVRGDQPCKEQSK